MNAIILERVNLRLSLVAATDQKYYEAGSEKFAIEAMFQKGLSNLLKDSLPIL